MGKLSVMLAAALAASCGAADDQKLFQPANDEKAGGEKSGVFQPLPVDPEVIRKSMQARAEYDRMNREIMLRKQKLFEENDELRTMQQEMRALQEKIDAILAEDAELKKLNAQLQEISPELPSAGARPFPFATTNQPAAGEKSPLTPAPMTPPAK